MAAKFKKGDRCRVVKTLLAPSCIGQMVTIVEVIGVQKPIYKIDDDGILGYAVEGCLEMV